MWPKGNVPRRVSFDVKAACIKIYVNHPEQVWQADNARQVVSAMVNAQLKSLCCKAFCLCE
jgi:hypothetical protein